MQVLVVFDTNILFSSLLSTKGNPFRCVRLAKTGEIESITCEEILQELLKVLLTNFNYYIQYAASAVDEVRKFSRIVKITNTLKVITNDPDDDKIIECAVEGKANYILTRDRRHLLKIVTYEGIQIVTPEEFLKLFSNIRIKS